MSEKEQMNTRLKESKSDVRFRGIQYNFTIKSYTKIDQIEKINNSPDNFNSSVLYTNTQPRQYY